MGHPLTLPPITSSEIPLLNIHFIDVGYGDAILLQIPEGLSILIDGGKPEAAPKVIAQLKKWGIKKLDYLFITHFHKDHAGGLGPILETYIPKPTSKLEDTEILLPFSPLETEIHEAVQDVVDALKHYSLKIIRRGEQITPSPHIQIKVLHPKTLTGDQNEDSLVLKIMHGANSFLLAADAGLNTQQELIDIYGKQLQADLIKIPHHANETRAHQPFIDAVNPTIAILSIGPNDYQAPNPTILEAYQKTGAELFRSDHHGNIHIKSDGQSLQVITEKT